MQIGLLNSGRYIGQAIGPFIATTVATTLGLVAVFQAIAAIQFTSFVILLLRNRRLQRISRDVAHGL